MSGYTGAGPAAGGGIGADPSAMASVGQGMPNGYQGVPGQGVMGGSPMGSQLPSSVQRMPGGFGLSPQLLQMIGQLQNRTNQGQQPFNVAQFQPRPQAPIPQAASGMLAGYGSNPYSRYPGR